MKRRSKSWLIAALVAVAAVMVLTGCSLSQVQTLTIVDYPATTYVVGPTPAIEFTVEALMDDGETRTLTYNEYSSILKLSGFSTEEVGSFTATVTYRNVSATFDYEVVEASSDFAGGVGTETNPYIINTLDQFKEIPNYAGSHFKLGADIDFSGLPFSGGNTLLGTMNGGSLDGNGYKLFNFTAADETSNTVFSNIANATIKNLDIYANIYAPLSAYATNTVFDTVDCYGEVVLAVGDNNYGNYFIYAQGDCVMRNCTNYREIKGASLYAAAFVGYTAICDSMTFENCINKANITAAGASVLVANSNQSWVADEVDGELVPRYDCKVIVKNCSNEAEVVGVNASNLVFAIGCDDSYIKSTDNQNEMADGLIPVKTKKTFYVPTAAGEQDKSKTITLERETVLVDEDSVTAMDKNFVKTEAASTYFATVINGENNNEIDVTVTEQGKTEVSYIDVIGYYYSNWVEDGKTIGTKLRVTYSRINTSDLTVGEAFGSDVFKVNIIGVEGEGTDSSDCWTVGESGMYEEAQTANHGLGIGKSATMTFYVFAYDADGNVLAGQKI